jgi:hypothetical protein
MSIEDRKLLRLFEDFYFWVTRLLGLIAFALFIIVFMLSGN